MTRRVLGMPETAWPTLLGGAAGAAWWLVFWPDWAAADDCLRYVQNVKNFVGIPKDLLEDCMRTGSVQAIITGLIAGVGGGVTASAIADALRRAAEQAGPEPHPPEEGTQPGGKQHCGFCGTELPASATACSKCPGTKECCVKCGKLLWSVTRNPTCASCKMAEKPADEPPSATCTACGKRYFPDLDDPNPGLCPHCFEPVPGGKPEEPAAPPPQDPPKPDPAKPSCVRCGHELPVGGTADGRCPACGSKQPTGAPPPERPGSPPSAGDSATSTGAPRAEKPETPASRDPAEGDYCPNCGALRGLLDVGSPLCQLCMATSSSTAPAPVTPPPPVPPPTSGTTPTTSTTSVQQPADPPFDKQSTVRGDRAVDLLEQSGLAHVTRDASGNVVRIDEAFPGAFTRLDGQTVTMTGGRVSGGGTGPDWADQTRGKITGIGFKPNPDGSIGEPVVVVNHGDTRFQQVPPPPPPQPPRPPKPPQPPQPPQPTQPPPPPPTGSTPVPPPPPGTSTAPPTNPIQTAVDAAQKALDAADAAKHEYQELLKKIAKADEARGAYEMAKIFGQKAADAVIDEVAKEMHVDRAKARELLEMDPKSWEGIKAAIKLPGDLLGS